MSPDEADHPSMPNPLSRVSPKAQAYFCHDPMLQRPELAALVAHVISTWARCDYNFASLLTQFLKSDFKTVFAMYHRLSSNDARRAMMDAAAESALSDKDFSFYLRVTKAVNASRLKRNDFCHCLWAVSNELPHCLLLIDLEDFIEPTINTAEMVAWIKRPHPKPKSFPMTSLDRSKIWVYTKRNLEHEVAQANLASQMLGRLHNALSDVPPARDPERIWIENALESLQGLPPKSPQKTRSARRR